jgi:hypothetical protein
MLANLFDISQGINLPRCDTRRPDRVDAVSRTFIIRGVGGHDRMSEFQKDFKAEAGEDGGVNSPR